jgi:glycosyltransferase involved in cell wall biosynthesis
VHYAIPHASAAWMAQQILAMPKGIRLPFITTLHGTDITLVGRDPSFEPVITFSIERYRCRDRREREPEARHLRAFPGEAPIRAGAISEVIPNFVCTDRYAGQCRSQRCASATRPNGEKLLVHVSNFRPVKRVEDVMRVFERQGRERIPSPRLLLIGDGP